MGMMVCLVKVENHFLSGSVAWAANDSAAVRISALRVVPANDAAASMASNSDGRSRTVAGFMVLRVILCMKKRPAKTAG